MLRKLLKHEFRATGRVILPIFGLLLLSAVGANLSIRGMTNAQSTFLNTLGTILIMLFFLAIIAVGIVALAVMVSRFYKNLLQDPAGEHPPAGMEQAHCFYRVVCRHGSRYHSGLLCHGL